ncbi:MAG: glycosyltransferase family 2 protein [Eubacteriales bacterium]
MSVSLDVIIVNWNSGIQLYNCLNSIQDNMKNINIINKVIVIDNHSSDNSIEEIKSIDIPLEIIRNKTNKGFGAACNQGATKSDSDYILFLNPDTILYNESLVRPLEFLSKKENSSIGVCGIKLVNENHVVQRSCCTFPTVNHFINRSTGLNHISPRNFPTYFMTYWDHDENKEVDHVIGAFYLIRNEVFKKVDGFDERFFVYLEDLDLSYRIKNLGYKIMYLSDVEAFHKGGGTSEQVKALRLFYSLRSRIRYAFKHFSYLKALTIFFFTMFVEPLSRILLGISKMSLSNIFEVLKGYNLLWKDLLFKRRKLE